MSVSRKSGRLLLALVLAGAAAAGIWALLRSGDTPPDRQPLRAVEFVPAPGGYHTAWLVAGPLEQSLPGPQAAPSPAENQAIAGSAWRLVASTGSQVTLPAQRPGYFYAAGALVSTGGKRQILLMAGDEAKLWVNGALIGKTQPGLRWGMHALEAELSLRPGPNPVLLESRGGAQGASFLVALRLPPAPGGAELLGAAPEDAPEAMSLTLADHRPQRLKQLLASSLALSCRDESPWTDPGTNLDLSVIRGASAPAADGRVRLRLVLKPSAGQESGSASKETEAKALLDGHPEMRLSTPAGNYLRLECHAEVTDLPAGGMLASPGLTLYCRSGVLAAAADVEARAAELGAKQGMNAVSLPLLKAEKARLMLGSAYSTEAAEAVLAEVEQADGALKAAATGRDPASGAVGWVERAYWSEVDRSAQPYRLYVPRALADPAVEQAGGLPLVVYLHGYVPSYDKHRWVEEVDMREVSAVMEAERCIMLLPFGRSNTDFVSVGEVDVLRAVEETCRLYPVDPRRVYLYGYSMGGYGAYALAAHFPDRFAGAVVLAGRPEPYYIEQEALRGLPRAKQPAYKGFCLDVDTPIDMPGNFRTVPTMVCHATRDSLVPLDSAKRMVAAIRGAGGLAELCEIEGDHWTGFDVLASPVPVRWLLQHRKPKRPANVSLRTYSPRYGRAYWAAIELIDRWTAPAELSLAEDGQGLVKVKTVNVREFALSQVSAARGLKVEGAEPFEISAVQREAGIWDVRGRLKNAPPEGRWQKTARLAGPMREACNGPFIVVYDEPQPKPGPVAGDVPLRAPGPAPSEERARRFAAEWQAFAKGRPPVKCETELTEEDKRTRSLILFCTPSRSKLLREAAPTLECRLTDTEFEIAGRKARLGADRGMVLTRPNPWAPGKDRYLVVCTGLLYGRDAAGNHKLDLIPDFVVFTSGSEGQGEPVATLAGFFDSDWKAVPALVEVFEPRPEVQQ